MPKIDKPSERELMKKKEREGEKKVATRGGKTRSPRNANIRVCPPGTFENARFRNVRSPSAVSDFSAAKRVQLKRDRNCGG